MPGESIPWLKYPGAALVLLGFYIAVDGLVDQLTLRVNTGFSWVLTATGVTLVGIVAYLKGDGVKI